ncbi:MAG: sulfite exporter TauE/SafE family protein [Pseudomonadales bacterium]|nr:sulfite exporter TauE/SafE family protein [Pseudomonadales bacterium]
MAFLYYILLGSVAGTLAGLLGVGGGLVIVPVLVYLFQQQGFAPEVLTHMAVGTSLATIVMTSISSIRTHHAHGAVQWSVFKQLVVGIVIGSLLGAVLADFIQGPWLQLLIGIFALVVAAQMGFGLKSQALRPLPGVKGMFISGGVIGSISALFGIGGGSVTVPLLTRFSVPAQQAVATSAACGLPIAVAGSVGFMATGWGQTQLPALSIGYIYLPAFLGIVLSSTLFAIFGARLAHQVSANTLKKIFALLLFVIGLRLVGAAF